MSLKIVTFCIHSHDWQFPFTAVTTESTDPPSASEGSLGFSFRLEETFTSALGDPNSPQFKTLAANVTAEVRFPFTKT